MRKFVVLALVLVLPAAALHCSDNTSPTEPVFNAGQLDLAGPAVVIRDLLCGVVGINEDGPVVVLTTDVQVVDTRNDRGNGHGRCRAKGVPNVTGRAQQFTFESTGFPCTTPLGDPPVLVFTTKWHETLSASGVATISCFHPDL